MYVVRKRDKKSVCREIESCVRREKKRVYIE